MKKQISLLLAMVMLLTLFAGCGSSSDDTTVAEEETEAAAEVSTETEAEETDDAGVDAEADTEAETTAASALPDSYPLIVDDGSITLTMFQVMVPLLSDIETFNELYWWQQLSERTGVTFEWNMIAMAAGEEQFNLLVAANDLPNITCTLNYYSETISYAVENDVFVNLTPYLEEYAPDYLEVIMQDDVYPVVSDEDGNIIAFYEIGYEDSFVGSGVVVRGDLLEAVGMDVPVTYDEYEEVALALKNDGGVAEPIYLMDGADWLLNGMGVQTDFSLDVDGNCIYGPVTDAYRSVLSIANRWYEEGLINENFYTSDYTTEDESIEQVTNGTSAFATMDASRAESIETTDPDGYIVPGYLPRENADDEIHLTGGVSNKANIGTGWALSPSSTEEEIQTACMLINYFYTEEGTLFVNYGVEGVSFEYQEDGTPWYTELITDNPDGLTQFQAVFTYLGNICPSLTDFTRSNISALSTMTEFIDVWDLADNSWDMPQVTLTLEESEAVAAVSTDVETYLDEAIAKFIRGDLDIDDDTEWENYLEDMESLGVDIMIEAYSAALERYNARIG